MMTNQILSTGDPMLDRQRDASTQDGAWTELMQHDSHATTKAWEWCVIERRWRLRSSPECGGCQSVRGIQCSCHRR